MNKLTYEDEKQIAELEERQKELMNKAIASTNFEEQLKYLREIDFIILKIECINCDEKRLSRERLVFSKPPQDNNNKPRMEH